MPKPRLYSRVDIVILYLTRKLKIGDKFEYIVKDYEWSIHGNYYKYTVKLNENGLWKEVFTKEGRLSNSGYWELPEPDQINKIYKKIKP